VCLLSALPASAQQRTAQDSIRVPADTITVRMLDTLLTRGDTARAAVPDTIRPVESPSGIDSVVTYSAVDSVVYSMADRTMYLYGKGSIRYKELGLKAEHININWDDATLHAEGISDSSDSTGNTFSGLPEMVDGNERYGRGHNFRTKKEGLGKTEIEPAVLRGRNQESRRLLLYDGRFTIATSHPHYYFYSPEMKIVVGDRLSRAGDAGYRRCRSSPAVRRLPDKQDAAGVDRSAYGESGTRGRYLVPSGLLGAQ
jgi:hypothetical protein